MFILLLLFDKLFSLLILICITFPARFSFLLLWFPDISINFLLDLSRTRVFFSSIFIYQFGKRNHKIIMVLISFLFYLYCLRNNLTYLILISAFFQFFFSVLNDLVCYLTKSEGSSAFRIRIVILFKFQRNY